MDKEQRDAFEVCLDAVLEKRLDKALDDAMERWLLRFDIIVDTPEKKLAFKETVTATLEVGRLKEASARKIGNAVVNLVYAGLAALVALGVMWSAKHELFK